MTRFKGKKYDAERRRGGAEKPEEVRRKHKKKYSTRGKEKFHGKNGGHVSNQKPRKRARVEKENEAGGRKRLPNRQKEGWLASKKEDSRKDEKPKRGEKAPAT